MKELYVNGVPVEISDEIYTICTKSDRKMRYMQKDLKNEKVIINMKKGTVKIIPSREDSLTRLVEDNKLEFAVQQEDVNEIVEKEMMIFKLTECIKLLNKKEMELINALFFSGLSEREYALKIGLSQKGVNKRKQKILMKLKKVLDN